MVRAGLALLICAVVALGCSAADMSPDGDDSNEPRVPLGKADNNGVCKADNGQSYCGGKSKGTCWCDSDCERYGDCCADKVSACGGLGLDVDVIDSASKFDAIAFKGQDGVVLGKSVKFLIDARNANAPAVHFMNANYQGP